MRETSLRFTKPELPNTAPTPSNGHNTVAHEDLFARRNDEKGSSPPPITAEAVERLAQIIAATHFGGAKRDSVASARLPLLARDFDLDCEMRNHSIRTRDIRALALRLLHWYCDRAGHESCGQREIRAFFHYLQNGHAAEQGRWMKADGSARGRRFAREVSPRTVKTYWNHLSTFFQWLVREAVLDVNPFAGLEPPLCPAHQVRPFTPCEVRAILQAAKESRNAPRDVAIVRFLFDTGIRVSELCALRRSDVDLRQNFAEVLGKGRKKRVVSLGLKLTREIYQYLATQVIEGDGPLFTADKSGSAGNALTRGGVLQIIKRLCRRAGVSGPRCSPHTFRHIFAVEFLRAGGNVFTLKEILGHSSLHMTNRYVALAQADIAAQHRRFSPGDRLGT